MPRMALVAAAKAAQDAPAYRMKVTSTDPAEQAVTAMTLEVVKPDSVHMKSEAGGGDADGNLTDGKNACS